MSKDNELIIHSTAGSGDTVKEVSPHDELPEKLLRQDGAVINLDTGHVNTKPDIIDLCGRKVDYSEFGKSGESFIIELYEQWLNAVQNDQKSTFTESDSDLVNSYRILSFIPAQYNGLKKKVIWRNDDTGKRVGHMLWDRDTTFDEWMVFTLATLRWRYNEEIDGRRITHALKQTEIDRVKELVGECIASVEKWLSMPDTKKLTSI